MRMPGKYQLSFMLFGIFGIMVVLSSCVKDPNSPGYEYMPDMYRSAAYKTYEVSPVFEDSSSARQPVEGTISRGEWPYDANEVTNLPFAYPNTTEGYEAAGAELSNPVVFSDDVLADGERLYQNFCSYCHGAKGEADGTLIQNDKFPPPPSFVNGNSSRGGAMKDLTPGKIFHTMTYGVNLMGSHASQLNKEQRWKIVYYVQTLQGKQLGEATAEPVEEEDVAQTEQ